MCGPEESEREMLLTRKWSEFYAVVAQLGQRIHTFGNSSSGRRRGSTEAVRKVVADSEPILELDFSERDRRDRFEV